MENDIEQARAYDIEQARASNMENDIEQARAYDIEQARASNMENDIEQARAYDIEQARASNMENDIEQARASNMEEDKASSPNKGKYIDEGNASDIEMATNILQKLDNELSWMPLQRNGPESRRSECCRVPKPLRDPGCRERNQHQAGFKKVVYEVFTNDAL
ncbi:hypothetical protein DKX38_026485 [Salix brachista]|uniref:Uncharacterized protein n=1 Tax=Salix brachista TaxID=2182728 RepID=A0A5N5JLD4_9ROSI|nr:hypothetical protein DKX38_026485 [Salix brachista]